MDGPPRFWGVPSPPGVTPVPTQKLEAELIAARNALRESDARFQTLADAFPHMVWSTLPDGFHDYYNARWYEFTGVPAGSTDGEAWNGMFHPDDQARAWETWRHSLTTGEPYHIEYRLRHHSGEYRWTLGRAMPLRDDDGRIVRWLGTCTDIHRAKQDAANNEILSQELSHRIKNIFAVIGALISLSARGQPQVAEFARTMQQRVAALGRAHEFVRPHSEESAPALPQGSLKGMLEEILAPYPALSEGRLQLTGSDFEVNDRGATPLALLIHELATNASKYGALSVADGQVRIATEVDGDKIVLRWSESGGPALSGEPARTGFGTRLIDLSVAQQLGGKITREWLAEGLRVEARVNRRVLEKVSQTA